MEYTSPWSRENRLRIVIRDRFLQHLNKYTVIKPTQLTTSKNSLSKQVFEVLRKRIIENRHELMECSLKIFQMLLTHVLINTEGNKQDNIVTNQLMKTEIGFQGSEKLVIKDFRNQYYVCSM